MTGQGNFWDSLNTCKCLTAGKDGDIVDIYCEIINSDFDSVSNFNADELYNNLETVFNSFIATSNLRDGQTAISVKEDLRKLKRYMKEGIPYHEREWFCGVYYFFRFLGFIFFAIWRVIFGIIMDGIYCVYFECREKKPI